MSKRNADATQKQPKPSMKSITENSGDARIELTEQDLKRVSGGQDFHRNKKL